MRRRARNLRRLAGVLVGTGARAAPGTAVATLVMSLVAAGASVTFSVGFREMVDGALAHDRGQIALGAALAAGLFTLAWLLAIGGATRGALLTDMTSLALGVRIARLVATLPTLDHFERPQLLARVEQVTDNRRVLAGALRQLIGLSGQALRAVLIVILLATVYVPVLLVPALALAPALSDRYANRLRQRADDAMADDRRLLNELFGLATSPAEARELRTYGITRALAQRHAELTARVRRATVRTAVLSSALEAAGWLVFAVGLVGAIAVLVLRAAHGHVSPGQVVMSVSLLRRAQTQISRSTDTAGNFSTALTAARALVELEDRAAGGPAAAAPPARLTRGIELHDVAFAYGDESVLGPLSLTLPAGATVALVGENGAGKTTLVKLLCGLHTPTSGGILIDGTALADLDPVEWRRHVSGAFQDFVRFEFPLRESVGVGDLPRIEDAEAVQAALGRAGAVDVERLVGLETRVGGRFTGGKELSGGQWQRVALARGLMRAHPLLVVLDEPTASLDAPSEAALFARYAEAARAHRDASGTITLLVSHRFSTVRSADLIVVLDHGRIVETGSHDALLAAGGTYADLFQLQARGYAPA